MIVCEDCNNFRRLIDDFICLEFGCTVEPDDECSLCPALDLIKEVKDDRASESMV